MCALPSGSGDRRGDTLRSGIVDGDRDRSGAAREARLPRGPVGAAEPPGRARPGWLGVEGPAAALMYR